ncbi:HlyD family secretion protein [Rivibacter subsaxonicus]|uniref:Multidrug resistance efflux pump n=1 Tax=Rivibacter subsaxonicus TaxID=457575 RepID=A0A4Q7W2C8_9BURK|nr:biotin/lipoyl-binding protein [Rivibacter subsaxonicus]RZU02769.1 multidrug resistance efflux pump [Rivibacter subsaxonicus]
MEAILLAIYAFFVWLIFIKFKLLPWNITSQVIVVTIPIVGMTVLILTLNVVAPSSTKLRVYRYQVPIVSQVSGRVVEVGVEEGNFAVKRGDMLFRIDATPYELTLNTLKAQLANAEGESKRLNEQLRGAVSSTAAVRANVDLARKRVLQYRDLAASGAGNKFDLEQAEAKLRELESQLAAAVANQAQVQAQLGAVVGGDVASVAKIKSDIALAQWQIEQTVTRSPCDCTVVNLQLRPGVFVTAMPFNNVMTLVERSGQVLAVFGQNELRAVKPGDAAEFAVPTHPGRIFKAKVDSVVWDYSIAQSRVDATGQMPMAAALQAGPSGFTVKFNLADGTEEEVLAAGVSGDVAIYTEHVTMIHIIRKVILRVGSNLNYVIPKLH